MGYAVVARLVQHNPQHSVASYMQIHFMADRGSFPWQMPHMATGSHSCIIIIAPIYFLAGFIRCDQTVASFVLFGLVLLVSVFMFDVSFSAPALLFG